MWLKPHLHRSVFTPLWLSESSQRSLRSPVIISIPFSTSPSLHKQRSNSAVISVGPATTTTSSFRKVTEMNGTSRVLCCSPVSPVVPIRTIHLVNGKADSLAENHNPKYQAAVHQLNQLQSNATTLASHKGREKQRFLDTWKYLERSGLSRDELDKLPVIHVAGTKGKGSVCSIVESILRQHGLKTGFFSSPHLVSITERIRLNGLPISEEYFAKNFWSLFHRLDASKDASGDMPAYFKFLTLMAFHVFLAEEVDVAIVEVGIGGAYDCTNIIRDTKTVGITSLGLDHVEVLGDTIEKIAWQKAGIIKRNSNVFTVRQGGRANEVIEKVAAEKEASLTLVPSYEEYTWSRVPELNLTTTSVHKLNISLAIQLSIDWLIHLGKLPATQNRLLCTEKIISGIESFHWPGRYQVIDQGPKRFYLDGAHTVESIEACLEWFQKAGRPKSGAFKCLLFYVTGARKVESLAQPILNKGLFDLILICPNIVDTEAVFVDNVVTNSKSSDLISACHGIREKLRSISTTDDNSNSIPIEVLPSVSDALRFIERIPDEPQKDVLITGSLYLVGTALIALNQSEFVKSE